MKINGRCYCGQVKFTFYGEPRTVACSLRENRQASRVLTIVDSCGVS